MSHAVTDLLHGLNQQQQEAVLATSGPVLVVAGPGSGKTRVLTHRIAHLIQNEQVLPDEILAVTFTNKAAGEIKRRVETLIGDGAANGMWMGTFHSIGVRFLRQNPGIVADHQPRGHLRMRRDQPFDQRNHRIVRPLGAEDHLESIAE